MSNTKSTLVSCTVPSPNNSGQRAYPVTRITPHCMVGQLSAQACGALFKSPSREASSNYGIGTNGEIDLYVDETKRSWCSSDADNDNRAITIECASDTRAPYAMNSKVYDSLVRLCVDICQRYGKKKLLWLADKNKTLAYKPKDDEMIITVHRWFANKSCPGDWLYNRLGKLAADVNAQLQKDTKQDVTTTPEDPHVQIYRVQCGAFGNKKNAEKRVADLKKVGFDAVIMEG